MADPTKFDYLLNAFEQASQHPEPASQGYAEKRRALIAYVRDMEHELMRTKAVLSGMADLEYDAEQLRFGIVNLRHDLRRIPEEIAEERRIADRHVEMGKQLAAISLGSDGSRNT